MRPVLASMRFLPLLALAILPVSAAAGRLTVAISNVRSDRGTVHVDICDAARFLSESCRYHGDAPASAGTTIVTIDLPPGRYAAQAFHDENGNGKVDRALFGIPKEGVGFSNDAPIHFSPPKFAAAVFDHPGGAQTIRFSLRYFLGARGPDR